MHPSKEPERRECYLPRLGEGSSGRSPNCQGQRLTLSPNKNSLKTLLHSKQPTTRVAAAPLPAMAAAKANSTTMAKQKSGHEREIVRSQHEADKRTNDKVSKLDTSKNSSWPTKRETG